jgi:hypothetical protein
MEMILANISNGLAFPHDDVSFFQSQHGHNCKMGYFRLDAMPYRAIIHLMKGEEIVIVDATRRHKPLTDAQKFGVVTWALVYNRAIGCKVKVCAWQTPEMGRVALSHIHAKAVQTLRHLAKYYNPRRPAIIGDNVKLVCHQGFVADDNVGRIKNLIKGGNNGQSF